MKKRRDDPMTPICGAKTKRTGNPCQLYPCKNGRCYLHGGRSSGPKTLQGLYRIKHANTNHGAYSKEVMENRRAFHNCIEEWRREINCFLIK